MGSSLTLKDIPEVVIDTDHTFCKFIVAELSIGRRKRKLLIRALENCEHQRDIFKKLEEEIKPKKAFAIGGGRLKIDRNLKMIHVCGKNGEYGMEPNREVTAELIKQALPDYNITYSN